ncbi:hypothetical protein [Microbacterium sp. BK668]|uniref:hypothetical protein n=1 Tax=Microbacterium sp. BK668 TaxID=2512118 RepID=UPI00105D0340|nr:hypothetical protein [Microbacterium sp. BK668]TDN91695.1 phosphoglycerol transferase MdoB-like AlkP superfamily enzyme [Microbacterium sp. BK668]
MRPTAAKGAPRDLPSPRDPSSPSDESGSRAATVAAFATIVLAALLPGALTAGDARALLGIPFEVVALLLLLLVLPWRAARTLVAVLFGGLVVGAIVLGGLDLAFVATIDRPFEAAGDWPQVVSAAGVVADATGPVGLTIVLVLVAAVVAALVWALALAALRAGRAVAAAGRDGRRAVAVIAVAWIAGALLAAQAVPGVPLASADSARAIADTTEQTAAGIRERQSFDREIRVDSLRSRDDLLQALAGKDVVFAFIESYGRVAVEGSTWADGVDRALRRGGDQLARDGYLARSAFLSSPTFGGVSWLAHATLQSGLWVDSPQKYAQLTASDRFTLARAFARAGWTTAAVVPSNKEDWDAGTDFYGFETILDSRNLGYRGPAFSYALVPDQFTWRQFHDRVLTAAPSPVMAEIDFVSSHTPWTPLPQLLPWGDLGDGSAFEAQAAAGDPPVVVWQDPQRVKEMYAASIEYSLGALFSYLQTYDPSDLVLVVLGDHQPSRIVSGEDADRDVPVTLISKDPAVMARIDAWGWQPGVLPSSDAPVWRMDAFRDRFFDAFSGG